MKITPKLKTILALAGVVVAAQSAKAETAPAAGDLVIGFYDSASNHPNDYTLDLGPVSNYLNLAPGTVVNLNTSLGVNASDLKADLLSTFGTNWATDTNASPTSNDAQVQWGVIGFDTSDNTLYETVTETTPGKVVTGGKIPRGTGNPQGNIVSEWGAIFNSIGANGSTASSNVTSVIAATQPDSGANTFGHEATATTTGNIKGVISASSATNDATNVELDLFAVSSTVSAPGTYEGTFTLDSSGDLTYTVIPEPSTYAMLFTGVGIFALWARRRSQYRNTNLIPV